MSKFWLVIIFIAVLVLMSFLTNRDKKKKVIFFGDSITQAGVQPYGYITIMQEMLEQQNISNYNLIGAGINGNKVDDLYSRMDRDVLSKSPQIVVIYVGVNDVWHKKTPGGGTDTEKFEKFYRAIITKLEAIDAKIVVCTPAVIGEKNDFSNELDDDLNKYCDIIRNITTELHIPLADIRKAFLDFEEKNNTDNTEKGLLTTDGVHLNNKGNELVAELMWNVIKEIK
jgi:lysophospholipase L1-like esterase